jgi:hypothetical protein
MRTAPFKLLLAALLPSMVPLSASAAESILLACSITSNIAAKDDQFSAFFCKEAVHQLTSLTGNTVEPVATEVLIQQPNSAWLRLDVIVKSANVVSGQASWGGGNLKSGQGAALEAGINDATLNETTASLLVQALVAGSPFVAPK